VKDFFSQGAVAGRNFDGVPEIACDGAVSILDGPETVVAVVESGHRLISPRHWKLLIDLLRKVSQGLLNGGW
jgi:hypothetical protein